VSKITELEAIGRAFVGFDKPERYVGDDLYEPERAEYEAMLGGKPREAIEAADFGSVSWSPLLNLTPDAVGYLLPRMVELSEARAKDKDGDPFLVRFINFISMGPSAREFSLLDSKQRGLVTKYLEFIARNHIQLVRQECWDDVLEEAINAWRGA
jgi:hypothetical protein